MAKTFLYFSYFSSTRQPVVIKTMSPRGFLSRKAGRDGNDCVPNDTSTRQRMGLWRAGDWGTVSPEFSGAVCARCLDAVVELFRTREP